MQPIAVSEDGRLYRAAPQIECFLIEEAGAKEVKELLDKHGKSSRESRAL